MNTGKQINAMVVLLFVLVVTFGAYTIWDPFRSEDAEAEQLELTAERGASTFALNCRLCHGDRGEGGAEGGRLPAAAVLDNDRLQGIESGTFSQDLYEQQFDFIMDTIMCGRVGTFMPAWGRAQGGTLSGEQIRQLTVLITNGFWDLAEEHAAEIDAETTEHATLRMPGGSLAAGETQITVSNAAPFQLGQYIRIGEERLRVLPHQLQVERGVDGTEPADHERGVEITRVQPPAEPLAADEVAPTLVEAVDDEATAIVVGDIEDFAEGEVLLIGDERVRVTGLQRGLPTTGRFLAEDIGRETKDFIVSGSAGIEVGALIRMEAELLEVREIGESEVEGIELDEATTASAGQIAFTDAAFFREGYVVRVGDELIEVGEPVDTEQALGDTIGRAETRFAISGTAGISEGLIIRINSELMRVEEILSPTVIEIERGAEDTEAADHPEGTSILRVTATEEEAEGEEPPADEDIGQALLEALSAGATTVAVSGSSGLVADGLYRIDDELVRVVGVEQAEVRVTRAVEDTERAEHSRRTAIYEGNLLEVERGVEGTTAAAHDAGAEVFFTELQVKREAEGSALQDHAKGVEIFLGHDLIVERAVLDSEAAEHPNGELVYNFPPPPDEPAVNEEACGQRAVAAETPAADQTPIPGGAGVTIELDEFTVEADPASVALGGVNFQVLNVGQTVHNFRVIQTDLAPDALPVTAQAAVDEGAVNVVGGFSDALAAGGERLVPIQLEAGAYVLICNVPTHYEQGMFTGFEVTAP